MLHIAICDDLPDQLARIKFAVEQYYSGQIEYPAEIVTYDNPLLFLESLDKNGGFDILLLDICMPGITGIQVAGEIRKRKDKSEIIFLTNSDEFAVDAFTLRAAHYLIKPFSQTQFDEAMDRAMASFAAGQVLKIALKLVGGGVCLTDVSNILFVESFTHTQNVHLKDGEQVEIRQTMTHLLTELEALSPGQFVSPYKGYLVNQKAIRTVEPKQLVLQSGQKLPLSRGSFRNFQEQYFAYMFPEGGRP